MPLREGHLLDTQYRKTMHTKLLKQIQSSISLAALTLSCLGLSSAALAVDQNLAGTWKSSFTLQNGQTIESTLKLKQEGDKLSGVSIGRNGSETPLEDVTLKDDQLSFKITRERNGEKVTTKIVAKVSKDNLKGKLETNYGGENRTLDWEAKRAETAETSSGSSTGVAGNWKYDLNVAGNELNLVLNLKQDGEKVTGKVTTGDIELPISEGKITGDAISFKIAVDRDDMKFTSKYSGTVSGDNIKGKIHSDFGGQEHDMDWNATREKAVASATGTWKWVVTTDSGDSIDLSMKVKQENDKLSGVVILGENESPISEGMVKGNDVTFKVTRELDGTTRVSKFKGTLEGDTIKGKIDSDWSGEMRNYAWNAKRS
jgi:hypothetical protein